MIKVLKQFEFFEHDARHGRAFRRRGGFAAWERRQSFFDSRIYYRGRVVTRRVDLSIVRDHGIDILRRMAQIQKKVQQVAADIAAEKLVSYRAIVFLL